MRHVTEYHVQIAVMEVTSTVTLEFVKIHVKDCILQDINSLLNYNKDTIILFNAIKQFQALVKALATHVI